MRLNVSTSGAFVEPSSLQGAWGSWKQHQELSPFGNNDFSLLLPLKQEGNSKKSHRDNCGSSVSICSKITFQIQFRSLQQTCQRSSSRTAEEERKY